MSGWLFGHPLISFQPMNLTEFQQKIAAAEKPLVVDFWAPWCVPCKVTKPTLESLAQDYAPQVEFLALDADRSADVVKHYNIFGIPSVLAFSNGREQARVIGVQNRVTYQRIFESLAQGQQICMSISPSDRFLRVGAGLILGLVGLTTTNWLVIGLGAAVAFWGLYDRCPIWAALKRKFGHG